MQQIQSVFMIVDLFFFCCIIIATVKVLSIRSKRIAELEAKIKTQETNISTLYLAILKKLPATEWCNEPKHARDTANYVGEMHRVIIEAHKEGLVRENLVDVTSISNH